MYAIIKTGGKQYRVSVGDKLKVETLAVEAGAQVTLTEVLAVSGEEGLKVGAPLVEGATVTGTNVALGRHDLVLEGSENIGNGGSTRNGRDSKAKRLGVKVFGDAAVNAGGIIIRQRGTKFHAGNNVGMGKDHTLYALVDGVVKFEVKGAFNRQYVKVEPIAA